LSGTTTVQAVAVVADISSLFAAGTYTLEAPPTIALTPGSVTLTSSQTQTFTATVSGNSNTAVTWSLSPLVGSISTAGVYTAPASITSAQTVTVTATSVADPSVSASSSVLLTTPVSYQVNLSWNAPTSSPDPVAGYNIYRSPDGSSTYLLLNSSVDTAATYVDSTVQAGLVYDYIVESVDGSGVTSVPSNMVAVTIP
jgi:hypothetical protein